MVRIAIVSSDEQWSKQLGSIFPEWEMMNLPLSSLDKVLTQPQGEFDVIVFALSAVEAHAVDVVTVVAEAGRRARRSLVMIPARLKHLQPDFTAAGVFVLHEPTSSGELALGIRMLLR